MLLRLHAVQPPTPETGFLQPEDDVWIFFHDLPDKLIAEIFDHESDRSLVDPQIILVEPAPGCRRSDIGGIECVDEAIVGPKTAAILPSHRFERRDANFGSKR